MALHERWRDYTKEEILRIIKKKCIKCPYRSTITASDPNNPCDIFCDYFGMTGKRRGCIPEDCTHYLDEDVKKDRKRKFNRSGF